MNKLRIPIVIICLLLAVAGCRRAGLRGLVACTGNVTLDAKPLDGAVVTFVPCRENAENAPEQRNAFATTDASGRFTMTTLKEKDGVFPGKYWVMVTKYEQSGEFVKLPEINPETGENVLFEKSVNRLPSLYENYRKSGLEVTIPVSGLHDLVLELVSKD